MTKSLFTRLRGHHEELLAQDPVPCVIPQLRTLNVCLACLGPQAQFTTDSVTFVVETLVAVEDSGPRV